MRPTMTLFIFLFIFAFPAYVLAQDPAGLEQGLKPYGSYAGGNIDAVSMVNLKPSVRIPLLSYPQRGGKLNVGFFILYNSPILQPHATCDITPPFTCHQVWYTTQGGTPVYIYPDAYPYLSCPSCSGPVASQPYFIQEQDGANHQMGALASGKWLSLDATGYLYDHTNGIVTNREGTRFTWLPLTGSTPGYYLPKIEDTNGNLITTNANPATGIVSQLTDTVGRNIPLPYALPATDSSGCTGTLPIAAAYLWSPPGLSGGPSQYKICYATITANAYPPNCIPPTCTGLQGSGQMVQSVVLPSGAAWTFEYANGGLGVLTKITFPTGGSIAYSWNWSYSPCVGAPVHSWNPYALYITSRTLDANDSTGPHTYTYSQTTGTYSLITKVTDPLGNDSIHTETSLGGSTSINSCSYYETELDQYQGSQSSGTLLKKTVTAYRYDANAFGSPFNGTQTMINVLPTNVTVTDVPSSKVTQAVMSPDGGAPMYYNGQPVGVNILYGDMLSQADYDFGSGAPGPLLRKTVKTFMALSGPSSASYLANNLLDLPYTVQIQNGSGAQVAFTQYNYDETSRASSGLSSGYQWDSAPPAGTYRGNNTSIYRWLNSGSLACANGQSGGSGSNIISKVTYFDTGMAKTIVQPCGNTSSYAYSLTYWAALPTTVTNALSQSATQAFDFNTGRLTSVTDPNNRTTSFTYDSMWRMYQASFPDGGQKTFTYQESSLPFSASLTEKITSAPVLNLQKTATFDGFGRPAQTQLNSDPDGPTYVNTTHDALGRLYCTSNPFRSNGDSTYGITTQIYDALGRVTQVQPPDYWSATSASSPTCANVSPSTTPANPSNKITTSYSGNTTTVTDQAGKSRKSVTDALGRLTQVLEDPSGLGYETDYQYDVLDNLVCVAQKGTNSGTFTNCASTPTTWRPRTFGYDGLSRLTSATNPESGTVSYSYDPNGNLLTKTSPKPNQTGTATVVTCYGDWNGSSCNNLTGYDALNRVLKKTFSDGLTPTARYAYDSVALTGCTTAPPTLTESNPIGNRTAMCDGAGAESWSHDSMGRILSDSRTTNGLTATYPYTYNLDGSVNTVAYGAPGSTIETITYSYTFSGMQGSAGRPVSANSSLSPNNYVSAAHYAPNGAICGLSYYGWGAAQNVSYNNRFQPQHWHVSPTPWGGNPAPPPCQPPTWTAGWIDLTYNYVDPSGHDNGNAIKILSKAGSSGWSQNFTYDSLNRIATAQTDATISNGGAYNCWAETYTIDAWGNLLSNAPNPTTQSAYTGCVQEAPANLTGIVQPSNRLSGMGYTTDAAGNLIADGVHTFTFDAENHLLSTAQTGQTTVTYQYDGDGKRVQKSSGTLYWYGLSSAPLLETSLTGSASFSYYYFNGRITNRRNWIHWNVLDTYVPDALGNTRLVSGYNNVGGGAWDWSDYYPYGGEWAHNYYMCCIGNHYKFTGKERDPESNLDNFGARYYTSNLGHFMSPDSGVDQHPEAPQSWNLYSYALNNPLNLVDPTGEYVCGAGITQTMCDNFQNSLNAAQVDANRLKDTYGANSTEYKDAQRAIDFYGQENIDNGVTLTLGPPKGAEGQVDPNVGSTTPTIFNPRGQKISVHFAESAFSGSPDEAALITHEGSHGADASDWVKSGFSPAKNPSLYKGEWRAFHVSQSIAEASGYGPLGFFVGQTQKKVYIWEPVWAKQAGWGRRVDGAIDSMLRDKNGTYGLNPNSKVGGFQHNTKGNQ